MRNKEFLRFQDYRQNPDPHGWVTIARKTGNAAKNGRYVFSALASPASVDGLLTTCRHEVAYNRIGIQTFTEPNDSHVGVNVLLEPFVTIRKAGKAGHNRCELAPGFVRHYDLFLDQEKCAYVDPDGEEIARTLYGCMQVREDSLLDYLAARKRVLVLYYVHHRRLDVDVAEVFGTECVNESLRIKDARYELDICPHEGGAYSWFRGKRIVRPSPNP